MLIRLSRIIPLLILGLVAIYFAAKHRSQQPIKLSIYDLPVMPLMNAKKVARVEDIYWRARISMQKKEVRNTYLCAYKIDQISDSSDYKQGRAYSHYLKGLVLYEDKNYDSALYHHKRALLIQQDSIAEEDSWQMCYILSDLAQVYEKLGNQKEADLCLLRRRDYMRGIWVRDFKELEEKKAKEKKNKIHKEQEERDIIETLPRNLRLLYTKSELTTYKNVYQSLFYANEVIIKSLDQGSRDGFIMGNFLVNGIFFYMYTDYGDFQRARNHVQRQLHVAKQIDNKRLMAQVYSRLGYIEYQQKKYNKALENYIWQVYYAEKNEDKLLIAEGYDNIAKVFYLAGDMTNAYTFYDKSSALWRHLCDGVRAADSFRGKGLALQHQKEYDKALYAFQEELKYGEAREDKDMIATAYNHIGALYYVQNKLDSAKTYYNKSLELKVDRVDIQLAYVYFNLGLIAVKEEKWEEAYAYFLRSEAIAKAEKDSDMIASNQEQLGKVSLKQHEFSKADHYLNEGLSLSIEIKDQVLQADIEKLLATCYQKMGEASKANQHHEAYEKLQACISKADQQAALGQQQNCQELLKTYTSTTKQIRALWWKWLWAKGVEATSGLFILILGFALVRWVVKLVKHTKDHLKIMDVVIAMLDKYLSDWDEWPKLRRRLTNVGNHLNRLTAWVSIFRKRSN